MTLQIERMSNNGSPQWIKEEEGPQRQKKRNGRRGVNMPSVVIAWRSVHKHSKTANGMIKDTD